MDKFALEVFSDLSERLNYNLPGFPLYAKKERCINSTGSRPLIIGIRIWSSLWCWTGQWIFM